MVEAFALGELLLEPEVVVLLGPIEIDLTSPHGFECALHTDGTDVNVAENEGDEQDCANAMNDVGDLPAYDARH